MNGQMPDRGEMPTVRAGTQLNAMYEIDELIAAGGMGEVFKGHNIQTGDPVAIKIVLPEFARDEMIRELFRKEARILNHLAHDAIVRYYVFSVDQAIGRPYLAMEYVDGHSLAERIKSGPLATEEVLVLQRRLADGLEKAHEAGVIHRDISPDNVILPGGRVDRAKIIDFGIARSTVGGTTLLGGSFAGKYNFVSPEQLGLFGGEVTPQSDIYSLGLVLAAASRGKPIDMSGSQVEVIEKRRIVPELSGIDPRLHELLVAMLQPDPAERFASMAEVRDWQPPHPQTATRGDTVIVPQRAHKTAPPRVAPQRPAVRPATLPAKRRTEPLAHPRGRNGLLFGTLAVIAILGGAFGGWYYVERQSGIWPAPPPLQNTTAEHGTSQGPAEPGVTQTGKQQSTPPASTSPEPPKTEVASPLPPKQAAPVGIDAAELASFIRGYDGGKCFFAEPANLSGARASIIGYGDDQEAFARFLQAFKAKAGFEPDIKLSQVEPEQCPVIEALRKLTSDPAVKPLVQLEPDILPLNRKLNISVSQTAGRYVYVLFADHQGTVQTMRKSGPKPDGKMAFPRGFQFNDNLGMDKAGDYRPGLIVAISATRPLDDLIAQPLMRADELMPALVEESTKSHDIAMGAKYFKFVAAGG